jgi:hypothetical protein
MNDFVLFCFVCFVVVGRKRRQQRPVISGRPVLKNLRT